MGANNEALYDAVRRAHARDVAEFGADQVITLEEAMDGFSQFLAGLPEGTVVTPASPPPSTDEDPQ